MSPTEHEDIQCKVVSVQSIPLHRHEWLPIYAEATENVLDSTVASKVARVGLVCSAPERVATTRVIGRRLADRGSAHMRVAVASREWTGGLRLVYLAGRRELVVRPSAQVERIRVDAVDEVPLQGRSASM